MVQLHLNNKRKSIGTLLKEKNANPLTSISMDYAQIHIKNTT